MRILLRTILIVCVALSVIATGFAQGKQANVGAIVQYFDDPDQIVVTNPEGFSEPVELGHVLSKGYVIQTKKSTAEILLQPNGSIIKLAQNTNFRIDAINGNTGGSFAILAGKIRTVAAKTASSSYQFQTPTAVGGVRGTDFGIEVGNGVDKLVVREGLVDFTNNASKQTVSLAAGQFADTFANSFAAQNLSAQDIADFFNDLNFEQLNPSTVPGQTPAQTQPDQNNGSDTSGQTGGSDTSSPAVDQTGAPQPTDDLINNPILAAIKKALGFEIGSVTLEGTTYGKIVVQPQIITDDFKIGFYLPLIYSDNIFTPDTWYKPLGNQEWSFGTDQGDDVLNIIGDVLRDLVLKIKYVEIFDQGDPFFLKVGSLPSMTLGHGFLIGSYANDADFPAVRRLGFNIGIDATTVAFELLANDLARLPDNLYGFRFLWKPAAPNFKLGFGLSAALDVNPASSLPLTGATAADTALYDEARRISPMFLGVGLDLDLPIIEGDIFSIKFFTDFGGMIPYLADTLTTTSGDTIAAGFQGDQFLKIGFDQGPQIQFKNFGLQTGVLGKVLFVDYRLQFEYYNGNFRPSFFDNSYDRDRGQRALVLIDSLKNPGTVAYEDKLGIFGQAGADILNIIKFTVGYKWPWEIDGNEFSYKNNPDYFVAKLGFADDFLPFGLGFSISYERTHLKDMVLYPDEYSSLFDAYGTLKGLLEVPLGSFFKIRVQVGTTVKRDSTGAIDMSTGKPIVAPSLTIETVL